MENDETSPLRKTPKQYDQSAQRSSPDKSKSATSSSSSTATASAKMPASFAGALIPVAPTSKPSNIEKVATSAPPAARCTPTSVASSGKASAASATSQRSVGSSIGSTTLFPSDIRPVGDKMVFAQRKSGMMGALAGSATKHRMAVRSPSKGGTSGRSSPSSGHSSSRSSSSDVSPCPLDICKQRAGVAQSAGRQATTGGSSTPTRTGGTSGTTDGTTGGTRTGTTGRGGTTGGKTAVTTRQPMPKITFEKRSDDECMGGVVRWAEKCDRHVVRRQPWNCTRWTESKLQHPNMIGRPAWEPDPNVYVGTTREQKQQPLYSTSKANCDHCEKRFCGGGLNPNFAPPPAHDSPCCNCCAGGGGRPAASPYDNWGQPQGPPQPAVPDNIPFMRAPQCPEDHLFDTPTRCQARFGMGQSSSGGGAGGLQPPPPSKGPPGGYPGMSQHMVTNVMKLPLTSKTDAANGGSGGSGGRNYLSLAAADPRFSNIVSHISGFDSQLTVPLNTNYMGYSQKYPQDVIKQGEAKSDS